jgi:hypothetical protein
LDRERYQRRRQQETVLGKKGTEKTMMFVIGQPLKIVSLDGVPVVKVSVEAGQERIRPPCWVGNELAASSRVRVLHVWGTPDGAVVDLEGFEYVMVAEEVELWPIAETPPCDSKKPLTEEWAARYVGPEGVKTQCLECDQPLVWLEKAWLCENLDCKLYDEQTSIDVTWRAVQSCPEGPYELLEALTRGFMAVSFEEFSDVQAAALGGRDVERARETWSRFHMYPLTYCRSPDRAAEGRELFALAMKKWRVMVKEAAETCMNWVNERDASRAADRGEG